MKQDEKIKNGYTLTTTDNTGNKRTVHIASNGKMPRIIYLKMLYGDDYIDYIKDEYGVDNFLQDNLEKEDAKSIFLKNDNNVKEFSVNWIAFVAYYTSRYGQNIRDKGAINELKKEEKFEVVQSLYNFRCKLFKADFVLNEDFHNELGESLIKIQNLNKIILDEVGVRNNHLIENKTW